MNLKVKGKVISGLQVIKHHDTKTCIGVEVQLHYSYTSALHGSEWSASRPCRFTPQGEVPVLILYEAGWCLEPVWT
jgi:hypothetical protein